MNASEFGVRVASLAFVITACAGAVPSIGEIERPAETNADSIISVLRNLNNGTVPSHKIGWFDLDADKKKEAIVLMTGADWCGTGGCTLFILKQRASSWDVISKTPTSRTPISVLETTTNGWRDLSIVTQGGGNNVAVRTRLKFAHAGYTKATGRVPKGRQITIIR